MDGMMTRGCDVYSFGVLLWEMCSGKKAWAGSSIAQVIYSVTCKGEKLVPPQGVSQGLKDLMVACMAHERHTRPEFSDIVVKLDELIQRPT